MNIMRKAFATQLGWGKWLHDF